MFEPVMSRISEDPYPPGANAVANFNLGHAKRKNSSVKSHLKVKRKDVLDQMKTKRDL